MDTAGNSLYSAIVRFRCGEFEGYRLWNHGTKEYGSEGYLERV